jgi:hypothetical protein
MSAGGPTRVPGNSVWLGLGEMGNATHEFNRDDSKRMQRTYRMLLAASIILAAIGAPLLMQGAVFFTQTLTHVPDGTQPSVLWALGVFALSSTPLGLAGYTWRRIRGFQDIPDREPTE